MRKHPFFRLSGGFPLLLLGLALAGCATAPDADRLIDAALVKAGQPSVNGNRGPLSAGQSKAILDRIQRRAPGDSELLKQHVAVETAITGSPLVIGNKVTLLRDGPATYEAMFAAIASARDSVNLETFILDGGEIGNRLADALLERQRAGVQANLIYDSVGSIDTPAALFDRLREGGVAVLQYNPINPLEGEQAYSLNHRDHRKLLIVDGKTVFTGGINFSNNYSSLPHGSAGRFSGERKEKEREKDHDKDATPAATDPAQPDAWRDTHVRIDGPVAAEFQRLFLATWERQKAPPIAPHNYFPALKPEGQVAVRAIGSTPDLDAPLMYVTLIAAIRTAESRIWLTNAYFAPPPQELDALKDAARRGVDVRVVLPAHSDSTKAYFAGHARYDDLLDAGVRIFERDDVLHAKTAVIDGVWSTIGSSNLDWRSVLYNDEVNAVILDPGFATGMEAMFNDDIAESTEITLANWRLRPLTDRLKEIYGRIWENLL